MDKVNSGENDKLIDVQTEDQVYNDNKSFQNLSKSEPNVVKSIRDTRWRWLALALISFMTFGSYFCYDSPNSLSDLLYRKVTHEADSEHTFKYNQLYSIIYYPNIVLPLIGGILIDRIGLYVTIVIVSTLLTIGQAVFMVAGFMGTDDPTDNWPFIVAMTGRFIYGLGGDILGVCQSTFVTKWFMGKELSLALGIVLSISWFGQSASSYTVPPLAESTSLGFGLMLGVIVLLVSFMFSIAMIVYDYTVDKIEKNNEQIQIDDEYKFHWRDLRQLNRIYWVIVFNCALTYAGMTFYNFSNDFFQTRYGFDQIEAARINSNCYLVCLFLAPLFGYISDRVGMRVTFSIVSTTLLTLCSVLFIVIPPSTSADKSYWGLVPILLMGVSSSIYAAVIFPMIPIVVSEKVLGTAYGACTATRNIGNSFCPILTGYLTFKENGVEAYFWVNISMAIISSIGIAFSFISMIFDKVYLNGILQLPTYSIPVEFWKRASTLSTLSRAKRIENQYQEQNP